MPFEETQPPEIKPEKEIDEPWELTTLEQETINPKSRQQRINDLLDFLRRYQELKETIEQFQPVTSYDQKELESLASERELLENKILREWERLDRTLPKKDPTRQEIEKKLEALNL